MKRQLFGTLASLMCIVFLGALPSMSLAKEGKWTKKADMPTARGALSTSVVNEKIYAIGGGAIEEYTPEGWPFAVSPHGKLATMWGKVKVGK